MKTIIININLQQGILLESDMLQPLGVFSRHHKVLFLLAGLEPSQIVIPDELQHFKVIVRFTDSIGLELWRPDGYAPFHEVLDQYNRMVGMTVATEAARVTDEA